MRPLLFLLFDNDGGKTMTATSSKGTRTSRRTILKAGGAALAAGSIGFPFIARGAKAEILIGGPASAEKPFRELFFDPFEKKMAVKIYFEGTNSSTNLAKMRAEKVAPKRSVVFMDDVVLMTAMDEGLLTPLPPAVANLGEVIPRSIGKDRYWVNYMVMKSGVAMNTKVGRPIASWNDLWDAKYKGRVIVPSLNNTEGLWVLFMAAALESGKPLAQAQFDSDAGFAKMKKIKPNLLTIYTNAPQAIDLLQQGEAWYIAGQFSQNVLRFREMGRPIDFAKPREGGFAMPQSVAMVKGAPHQAYAAQLIDFILGAEIQNQLPNALYSSPVSRKASIPAKLADALPTAENAPKELFLPDWENIRKNRPEWIRRWEREMVG
jgi:putative spermidine/putrescine transport system substrate-binding protein